MRKKLFTFLLALTASIGMMWAENPVVVTINKSEFTSSGVTKDGVTLARSSGSMTSSDIVAMDGSFEFSTSLGKFTSITIVTDANIMQIYENGYTSAGWPTGQNLGTSAAWTGKSETVLISCMVAGMDNITITCTIEPTPANPVIKLNADFSGSWADTEAFTDNGDGTASLNVTTLTAGEWYHFGVKVDDTWVSDHAAFSRENPSRAIAGNEPEMWFQADIAGTYTFTWTYASNTLTIGYPVPAVGMKGSWDNWADVVDFTDNGDGTASATKSFEHEGYYTFKTVLDGDDWRGNGEAFKRDYTGATSITGNTDMTLWIDAKGEYTFTWTYATNAIGIAYPTLPTIQTKGSWDSWTDAMNFTDNGDGTASATKHFDAEGYHDFKINVGADDWRGNGETFKRDYTGAQWINENGSDMKLYVDEPGDYTFTWSYVENALSITLPAQSAREVATNADPLSPSYHYSTFFHSTQNYKLTNDGTQAFIADLSNNDLVLTEIANGTQVIPANTAVILRKTGSNAPVVLTPTEENGVSVNPDDNSLEGVDAITAVTSIDGLTTTNCYVLSGSVQNGVGFYRINSENLKAHKAYVKYAGLQTNAPRRMRFVFNTATGVDQVPSDQVQSTKELRDGQLIIIKNGVRYNAQGQIVK